MAVQCVDVKSAVRYTQNSLAEDLRSNAPPSTASATKSSSAGKISKDAYSVGKSMERHGLIQEDDSAFRKYGQFEQEIRDIVNGQRLSTMKIKQVEEFRQTHHRIGRLNEDTVLDNILPLLIRRKYQTVEDLDDKSVKEYMNRLAKASDVDERDKIRKEHIHTNRFWRDDGLLVTSNCEFQRTLLPNHYEDLDFENELAKALSKADGMKNPKPDRCFGLTPESFPPLKATHCPGKRDPFSKLLQVWCTHSLIIEGKADRGEMAEACNQAARGERLWSGPPGCCSLKSTPPATLCLVQIE